MTGVVKAGTAAGQLLLPLAALAAAGLGLVISLRPPRFA